MFDDPVAVFVTGAAILVALFVSLGGLGGSKSKDEKVYPIILGFATGNPPYKVSQQTDLSSSWLFHLQKRFLVAIV